MGYYEQIGVENLKYEQKLKQMSPLKRTVRRIAGFTFLSIAAAILWFLTFAPFVLPFL